MATKFLDNTGLTYLWSKIKAHFATHGETGSAIVAADKAVSIPFGKLDSTSTSTVMTAQVDGISELRNGVCMFLMNGVVTSAANFTININGLGAKPVYGTMAAATRATTLFNVNYTGFFVFNETRVEGGCWDFYYGYNSNDNTVGYNISEYFIGTKKVKTAAQRYQLLLSCYDGLLLPVYSGTYSTATTKVLTTESFNPFGQIYYYNSTTDLAANASPAAATLQLQSAYTIVDLRYSFNTGSTLTAGNDIYLVCVPQLDGSVKLHSTPIAYALPTSEDGLVYKRLGKAYDTYRIILELHKPVYYYKNGAIREWTGVDCIDSMMIEEVVKETQNMISITYSELKALRDNNKLIAGMQYRITDYVTTTAQEDTQSANHPFDVIVRADNVNVLNENAYACLHSGDTYFSTAGAKLEAWELKYCIDNDATRFAWADATNGKGVIYYMKDEWNNECPYDFKNILFRYDDDIYVYTFSFYYDDSDGSIVDASIKGNDGTLLSDEGLITGVYGNIIKEHYYGNDNSIGVPMMLNHVVFVSKETYDGYFYGYTMNTIGKGCDSISFANNCHRNMLDSNCVNITLGESCIGNSFGNNCYAITLVVNNLSNTFGQECGGIVLNDGSYDNTFMSSCHDITIGENSMSCVFEPDCKFISFGIGSSPMHNYRNIHIGCNVKYVNIVSSSTTTDSYFLKNIDVAEGLCGSSVLNRLTLTFDTNKDYVQRAGRNSSGTVRIYCPDDEPAT